MLCGKRHGTPPIGQDTQPSLKYCMEACAANFACRSVDFNEATCACYYSNHQGEPNITTPVFSSAYAIGCAGACKSAPLTPPGPPKVDFLCGKQGLAYAMYTNNKPDGKPNRPTAANTPVLTRLSSKTAKSISPVKPTSSALPMRKASTATHLRTQHTPLSITEVTFRSASWRIHLHHPRSRRHRFALVWC